jgi:hypothetical protein
VADRYARANNRSMTHRHQKGNEFLVEMVTTIPDGTNPAEVDALRAAEAVRAKELATRASVD